MPVLYSRNNMADLMELNEDMYHVYIDSHVETGGGRETVFLRQHERGIPLTLRENFSKNGSFQSSTGKRDIIKVENEFQVIGHALDYGKIICLPMFPLTIQLITIEKQSPKLAGYINKRIQSLGLKMKQI